MKVMVTNVGDTAVTVHKVTDAMARDGVLPPGVTLLPDRYWMVETANARVEVRPAAPEVEGEER